MLIRTPWRRQPQTALGLAPYFAQRAIYVLNASLPRALTGQTLPSSFTVPVATPDGRAFDFVPTAPQALTTGTTDFWADGTSFTLLFQGRTIGSSANGIFGGNEGYNPALASNVNIFLPYSGDGSVYWRWGAGESEGTSSLSVAGLTFAQSDWWAFTVGPRGMEIWQNGVRVGSNSGTPSRTGTAGGLIGAASTGGGSDLQVRGTLIATFKEQLPAAFLARRDYWGIFKPQRRRVWAPSSAANQSIAVPAGSLTLTGRTPTVSQTAHQSIAVPAGSLTLTGQTPTVTTTSQQSIAVPAGALTLTGFAPTISANQSIAVPAGALTLTGLAPTVTSGANQAISVPAGALSLTGTAPSVTLTDHQSISVPAGSLSLSGLAPSVATTDHQSVAVPSGALTLTGFAPEIGGAQQIIVPAGTLTLTGYEPTVLDGSQVRQVPGGGRVRAVVNGRRFEGTRAELAMLLRKLAEEHAEEDDDRAEEGKPPKKRVIRLKSAEKATVETAPRTQAETTRIELPASVRESIDLSEADEIYREAYARRVAIQQDDDDVMQLAEQYRQKRIAAVQSLAKIIEKLRP